MKKYGNDAHERKLYELGYRDGEKEGLQKAIMILQLLSGSANELTESILQNSPEAIELRKIMAGGINE